MKNNKFKIGDKVKLKNKYYEDYSYINKDEILTVEKYSGSLITIRSKVGKLFGFTPKILKPAFSWGKFKEGKFDVHCETKAEAINFLNIAKEMGYKWINGDDINPEEDTEWENNKINTVYGGYDFPNFIAIGYGELSSYKTLEWSDYMNYLKDKKIEIKSEPFDFNDNMSEVAIEDFNICCKDLPYCQYQNIAEALTKLQLIESGKLTIGNDYIINWIKSKIEESNILLKNYKSDEDHINYIKEKGTKIGYENVLKHLTSN